MRKMILLTLCLVLVLAMAPPASAVLNNIVTNGDFQTGNLTGWTQVSGSSRTGFDVDSFGTPTNYYAASADSYSTVESEMFQVINAATSTGWIAGGTSETYNFSFKYQSPPSLIANTKAEYGLWYYNSNPASAPAFGSTVDSPNAGWVLLSGTDSLANVSDWTTVNASATIAGFQPKWFAIGLEGTSTWNEGYEVYFDDVSLTTQCTPSAVPIPPTALLLGSGLLGLVGLGWRRKKS